MKILNEYTDDMISILTKYLKEETNEITNAERPALIALLAAITSEMHVFELKAAEQHQTVIDIAKYFNVHEDVLRTLGFIKRY